MNKDSHSSKPWNDVPPSGKMLRPKDVVERIGLSRSQVYQMIADGRFPAFIKISERASVLPESWFNAFIAHCAENACHETREKV
ncbi:MAG TPA: DNA-binding protein [Maritimibacter sp.]|nr:DNA-binding protein [Maritimibacter sp.]